MGLAYVLSVLTFSNPLGHPSTTCSTSSPMVFLHSLKRYAGREVPANVDSHTNVVLHSNTFTLTCRGSSLSLDRQLLNTLSLLLTIAASTFVSPSENALPAMANPLSSSRPLLCCRPGFWTWPVPLRSRPSVTSPSRPLLPRASLPNYGVYFCRQRGFDEVLLRDGIKPTSRLATHSPLILLINSMLPISATYRRVSRNPRSINPSLKSASLSIFPATHDAGYSWYSLGKTVIGTTEVPFLPAFFHCAFNIAGLTPTTHWLSSSILLRPLGTTSRSSHLPIATARHW